MIINVNTEYNVGEKVYVIYEDSLNNDFFCSKTVWRVMIDSTWQNNYISYQITQIIVKQNLKSVSVGYDVNGYIYYEEDMFKNLEDALIECQNRNKS